MSGSSGGSGGIPVGEQFDCDSLSFSTDINSPQQSAIEGLTEQDVLDISVDNNRVVAKRRDTGEIVGGINWTYTNRLISCIMEGHTYQGAIRSIDGGLIKVYVSPVRYSQ